MALPALFAGLGALIASGAGSAAAAAGNAAGNIAEIAYSIGKILLRAAYLSAGILAFIVFLNICINGVSTAINQTVLNDIFAMVQLWLPFNLNSLLMWLTSTAVGYLTYRLVLAGTIWAHRIVGTN